MKTKIKVTFEYIGGWSSPDAHEYRITKIFGAPTVEARHPSEKGALRTVRIGDVLSEGSTTELSQRVEITTILKSQ